MAQAGLTTPSSKPLTVDLPWPLGKMMLCNCCMMNTATEDNGLNILKQIPAAGDDLVLPKSEGAYSCTIAKQAADQPVGLHLDLASNDIVYVVGLRAGDSPVAEYNESAEPDELIRAGDYIMSVNGIAGDGKKMLELFQTATFLEMEVRRAKTWFVEVDKNGGRIGLELNYAQYGKSLVVDSINEGVVQVWNAANPERQMMKGDRILSVNGQTGTAVGLLSLIASNDKVAMEVSRPAGLFDVVDVQWGGA